MRHCNSFIWILLLTICVGCQRHMEKNVLTEDGAFEKERPQMVITAIIDRGNETKTILGEPGDGNYRPYWKQGDEIAVYVEGYNGIERFILQTGAGTDEATFSGSNLGEDLIGLYPYACITDEGLSNHVLSLELPAVQEYAQKSFGDGAYPMLAVGHFSRLVFKNLCALLQLSITGTEAIEAIRFRAHDPAMPVSGKATVRTDYDTIPELVMMAGESPDVTLLCDGVDLNPDAPTEFYLVIPPGTYKDGFEVEIISKSGKMVRSTQNDITFNRSEYRTIPTFAFVPEAESMAVPEPVDLGLPSGLKWASFNLGATRPEEYGDYYAWGETEPYYSSLDPLTWKKGKEAGYTWSSYKWCMGGGSDFMTKYCSDSSFGFNGFTDNKTVLDLEDDAACMALGGKWRMPTDDELTELRDCCIWEKTSMNGINGTKLTGPNGNSIFLPYAGDWAFTDHINTVNWGSYLSSSLNINDPHYAWGVSFGSSGVYRERFGRWAGFSIRPVYDDSETEPKIEIPNQVDLGLSVKWASFNLGASQPEDYGYHLAWGELEEKAVYKWDTYKWCAGSEKTLTKYNNDPEYGLDGFTDNKMELDPEDDAAHILLGEEWRIPSYKDWIELGSNCEWTWETVNGVNGYMATSHINGNSIFFPAAGYGPFAASPAGEGIAASYWSKSLVPFQPSRAYAIYFDSDRKPLPESDYDVRYDRYSIRPVYGKSSPIIPVESVALNVSEMVLSIGETKTLSATVLPENATSKRLNWFSSDNSIATVSPSGQVTGIAVGSTNIVVMSYGLEGGESKIAYCQVSVKEPPSSVVIPDIVDLGLSVKWASFNLGATKPEGYGDYFAWGDTEPYYYSLDPLSWKEGKEAGYALSSYKWCMGGLYYAQTKYCTDSSYGYNGFTDGKTTLDPEDDAAYVNLGGKWRMPTNVEFKELLNMCSWEWITLNGISGCKITGPSGGSIFLPNTGMWEDLSYIYVDGTLCHYWSSSLTSGICSAADILDFSYSGDLNRVTFDGRQHGFSIRPVYDD